jgi:hypothetical protein
MQAVSDLLGDQGGVASGAVVGDQVDLNLVLLGLVHDFGRVLDHLGVQHAGDQFVEREGLGKGFLVAHLQGGHKADNRLASRIKKLHSHLGKLLPEKRQPGPKMRSDSKPHFAGSYAMPHAPCVSSLRPARSTPHTGRWPSRSGCFWGNSRKGDFLRALRRFRHKFNLS